MCSSDLVVFLITMEVYIQQSTLILYDAVKCYSPSKSKVSAKRRKTRNDLTLTKSQSNDYFAMRAETNIRERSCTIAEPFSTETETLTQEMRDRVLHTMISRPELFRNTSSPSPNSRLSKIEVSHPCRPFPSLWSVKIFSIFPSFSTRIQQNKFIFADCQILLKY